MADPTWQTFGRNDPSYKTWFSEFDADEDPIQQLEPELPPGHPNVSIFELSESIGRAHL